MIFSLLGLLIGLLLISFGSVILYVKRLAGELFLSEDTCLKNFNDAEQLSILAGNVMCSLYCPCNIQNSLQNSLSLEYSQGSAISTLDCNPCENIQKYDAATQENITEWINSTLGFTVENISCAIPANQFTHAYFPSKNKKYIPLLTWLEENLQCSGLCTKQNIMLFSNINNVPTNTCYHSIKYWASENLLTYGIIILLFGFYEILISILAFTLACCTKKRIQHNTDTELASTSKANSTSFE